LGDYKGVKKLKKIAIMQVGYQMKGIFKVISNMYIEILIFSKMGGKSFLKPYSPIQYKILKWKRLKLINLLEILCKYVGVMAIPHFYLEEGD